MALFFSLVIIIYWLGPFTLASTRLVLDGDLLDELLEEERQEGLYYRLVDEDGRCLVVTGRRLKPGDCYLAADNSLYEVYALEGYLARARFKEKVSIEVPGEISSGYTGLVVPVQRRPAYTIAIYHSHNAESYVPSDGADSIYGRGGIHDVGAAFRQSLERKGIKVVHEERLHLPHDRGAYRRSRVTAQQLLGQQPDAIFDVHRDAAPWDAYAVEIEGEMVTQIQIVVGLSNPGVAANRNYAFDLKGYADRIHPGLVRGVFLIWGSYNQDLSPMNLLLEVGAHTNSKEAAMGGISFFADVVAYYFYGPSYLERDDKVVEPGKDNGRPPAFYRDAGGILGAISGTVLGLLLTSLGAALGFYLLNNPGALESLYHWWERAPQRLESALGQAKHYARNFPALARKKWVEFPANLSHAWQLLRRDLRAFPGWFNAVLIEGRQRGAVIREGGRVWLRDLPLRWRRSWSLFVLESRELPSFLQRRLKMARDMVLRVAGRVAGTVVYVWPLFRENLRLAWSRAAAEGAHLVVLIRENIILWWRSRLRS